MNNIFSGIRSLFKKSIAFEQAVQLWTRGYDNANSTHLHEAYRQSVWVNAAIKAVTAPIKGVSLKFFSDDQELPNNSAPYTWWEDPAVSLPLPAFVEATGGWHKLSGESFWLLDDSWFDSRAIKSPLILARPNDMREIITQGALAGWVYTDAGGGQHNMLPEEVVHLKQWNPYNYWRGLGELEAAKIAIETDYAAGRYARDTFRNAGDAGAYVTAKGAMPSEAQQTQIVAALREKRAARQRGDYRPVFLAGDIAVTDPHVQAPDAAFVSNRQLSQHEIFIAFGVPASMSDIVASYSIGSASDMFRLISNTCVPLAETIAQGINGLLRIQYPQGNRVRCYFDWDEHPVMQAVRRERIDSAVKLFNMGMPMEKANDYLDMELPAYAGWERGYLPTKTTLRIPTESIDSEADEVAAEDQIYEVMEEALRGRIIAKAAIINLKPTAEMAGEAALGLQWREKYGRGGTAVGVARARDIKNRAELSRQTIGRMVSYFARHGSNRAEHYNGKEADGGPTAFRIAWQLWGGDTGRTWSNAKWEQLNKSNKGKAACDDCLMRALPDNYRSALEDDVPEGRACGNCAFYNEAKQNDAGSKAWCEQWEEFVDGGFYCNKWKSEDAEQDEQGAYKAAPDALSVGDFVAWNSSGGTARGKIERIIRNGKLKVPDTSFTITGTEDNPAALIRIYRKKDNGYEKTSTRVGHKFSTLRKIDALKEPNNKDAEADITRGTPEGMQQRAALWNLVVQSRTESEKKYYAKFTKALQAARVETLTKIEQHSGLFTNNTKAVSNELIFTFSPWKQKLKSDLRKITTNVLATAVAEANAEIDSMDEDADEETPTPSAPVSPWKMPPAEAIRFIQERENLLDDISDEIHADIMDIIEAGMNAGQGVEAVADSIRNEFNQISNGRAKTIARTETGAAYGFAREQAMIAANIQYKEWLATPDDRCRETHLAADGQTVEINRPFIVGQAQLMFPCDPDGPPEEIINCRCVQLAVSKPKT